MLPCNDANNSTRSQYHVAFAHIKGVFGYEVLNFNSVTSDVRMLIRRTKHELIIKLIAEPCANSRDESIKPN